jgi:hypothetical protein
MKTVKVAEATGPALDWLVAKCEGKAGDCVVHAGNVLYGRVTSGFVQYSPSTDWSQGGPIVERERIELLVSPEGHFRAILNRFDLTVRPTEQRGPTPLVSAMRALVASKLGETAEVPEDLS